MTPSSSRLPVSSRTASLQPVRKPGSMASTRLPRSGGCQQQAAQVAGEDVDGVVLGPVRQLAADLALQARQQQPVQGVVGDLARGTRVRMRLQSLGPPSAVGRWPHAGDAVAPRPAGDAVRPAAVRPRRRGSGGDAGRRWRPSGSAARRRLGVRRQRQRQALQGDAPAGLGVPLQLDLQGVFLLAAVDGQDAVRRNVPDRLGELEVVLVLEPLPFGELLALGRAELAGVPQHDRGRPRARRPSRRSSRRGCAARRPARPRACSAPSRD